MRTLHVCGDRTLMGMMFLWTSIRGKLCWSSMSLQDGKHLLLFNVMWSRKGCTRSIPNISKERLGLGCLLRDRYMSPEKKDQRVGMRLSYAWLCIAMRMAWVWRIWRRLMITCLRDVITPGCNAVRRKEDVAALLSHQIPARKLPEDQSGDGVRESWVLDLASVPPDLVSATLVET